MSSRTESAIIIGVITATVVGVAVIAGLHIHESAYEQGGIDQIHADFRHQQEKEKERTNGAEYHFTFHLDDSGVTCVSYVDGSRAGWTRTNSKRTGLYWRRAFDNAPDVEYEFIVRRADISDAREKLDECVDVVRLFAVQTERLLKEADADQKEAATRVTEDK